MGNCANTCRKSDGDDQEAIQSKTGDKLEDRLNNVISSLEKSEREATHRQSGDMGGGFMDQNNHPSVLGIAKVEARENGKAKVFFENGGVYEGNPAVEGRQLG